MATSQLVQIDPLRVVFDRSRIEAWEKCPRKRFLEYEWGGTGMELSKAPVDLLWGICAHDALAEIMADVQLAKVPDAYGAAEAAAKRFEKEAGERGLQLEDVISDLGPLAEPANVIADLSPLTSSPMPQQPQQQPPSKLSQYQELTIKLAATWLRLAIPAWAFTQLPGIIQQYQIVSIEDEVNWESLQGDLLMTRHDVVVRHGTNSQLYVINFKTVGEPNEWWLDGWRYDQQTISEVLAVEQTKGERVAGVNIIGLVKGKKALQYPKNSRMWFNSSPFVWCWVKEAAAPFPRELAAKYEWTDDTGNHRLGKGWNRVPVWEAFEDPREWLQWLEQNEPELVRAQFVEVPTIMRSDREVEEWKQMVLPRERQIRYHLQDINNADSAEQQEELINEHFPKHTGAGNCIRPNPCPFTDVCWGDAASDPLQSGYRARTPNHKQEIELRSK